MMTGMWEEILSMLPLKIIKLKRYYLILLTFLVAFVILLNNCGNLKRSNPYDPSYKTTQEQDLNVYIDKPDPNQEQNFIIEFVFQIPFSGRAQYKDGRDVTEWNAYKWEIDGKNLLTGITGNLSVGAIGVGSHVAVLKVTVGKSYGESKIVKFKISSMY